MLFLYFDFIDYFTRSFFFNLRYIDFSLPRERTVEEGNCLSELYEYEKANGDELNMSVNTLKQMIRVTGTTSNLHQVSYYIIWIV